MNLSSGLALAAVFFYAAACVGYGFEFSRDAQKKFSRAGLLFEIGFLIQTLRIFVQTFSETRDVPGVFHLPVGTLADNSNFFAWSLAFVYSSFVKRNATEGFGFILSPVLILLVTPAFFPQQALVPMKLTYARDGYFYLHILSAFFGYASFALSFVAGLLYLFEDRVLKRKSQIHFYHKLVPLEALERFIFRTIFWGLALLGAAILSGSFWMKNIFGSYWVLDPKSLAAAATWVVYLALIYWHEVSAVKGRRVILASVWAFGLVLFTFLGTSVLGIGVHV